MLELVLGGTRSGKSLYAEQLAAATDCRVCYVATASSGADFADQSMEKRIARHQDRRPDDWQLVEEPLYLSDALTTITAPVVLIDCMGLWITNLLLFQQGEILNAQLDLFVEAVTQSEQQIIIVASEVGLGVVPANELSRTFVDLCGELNQRLASAADRVWFSVAGIPQLIKDVNRD